MLVFAEKTLENQIIFQQAAPGAPPKARPPKRVSLMRIFHVSTRRAAPSVLTAPSGGSERRERGGCFILDSTANHQFLDLADRLRGVEALRAHIDAVHDRMATEQTVRVFQVVETFASRFVAAIRNETIGLQQACRTDELV